MYSRRAAKNIMKEIKIAVIAHNCRSGGGLIGATSLIGAFKNVAQKEKFLLICSSGYGYEEIELPPKSELFVYKGSHSPFARYWFETITLPRIVNSYKPDVIFGSGNIGVTNPNVPQALLIHQAYLFYEKKYWPDTPLRWRFRIWALKQQIKKSLPKTDLIFCQTPIVRQRFSDKFGYPAGRIKVLRWPAPAEIKAAAILDSPPVIDKSAGNFYFLLLTNYMPHRNPSVLIPLCKRYGTEIRAKRIKFITTVEKKDGPHAVKFLKEISEYNLEDIIANVGYLSREDVLRYLSHSDVLWMPTTLETLCLPFLEAMAVEVPILAPDIDFARYVCGDAAIFYDPWDVESIFSNIMLMRENASLRKELVEKGKAQLGDRKIFAGSWEETATDLIRNLRLLVIVN